VHLVLDEGKAVDGVACELPLIDPAQAGRVGLLERRQRPHLGEEPRVVTRQPI
jgi:hypothetical protein